MDVGFDFAKRRLTLAKRELDFVDAPKIFAGRCQTAIDDRIDYGETRFVTYGWLETVAVAMVWVERDSGCRVISMRQLHKWEIEHVGLD